MHPRRSSPLAGAAFLLIVDDEPSILEVTHAMACTLGWQPLLANTAEHALRIFEQHAHAIGHVLVDLHMPGRDGIELARELREISPNVQIDVMTGDSVAAQALLDGEPLIDGVLVKPFALGDLGRALVPQARAA